RPDGYVDPGDERLDQLDGALELGPSGIGKRRLVALHARAAPSGEDERIKRGRVGGDTRGRSRDHAPIVRPPTRRGQSAPELPAAAGFREQTDTCYLDVVRKRLAHVINRERGSCRAGQRLHLDAGAM